MTILLALALSANASGKTMVRDQQGRTTPASASDSLLAWFPFSVPGCYPSGAVMGTKGQTITVSRAGPRTCNVAAAGAAPQLVTCQANEACVEASGLLVEPGRANWGTHSMLGGWREGTATTAWASCPVGLCTNAAAVDPLGTTSAVRIQISGQEVYNNVAIGSAINNRTFTGSVFCKTVSGEAGEVYIGMTDAASWAAGHAGQTKCSIQAGVYTRCKNTLPYTASGGATTIGFVIGTIDHGYGSGNIPSADLYCAGYQVEEGAYATSLISTAGSLASRAADAVSITNPLAATNPSTWCVEGTYTPESGAAWSVTGWDRHLASVGTGGAANSACLFVPAATGSATWRVTDGAGANRDATWTHGFSAGSVRRIGAERGPDNAVVADGVRLAPALSGTGAGLPAQPASIYIGSCNLSSGTYGPGGGYIQNFKVRKGACR